MPKVTLNLDFYLGQIVYLKMDYEQLPRMVIRIEIKPGSSMYCLAHGDKESWHSAMEITKDKDILKSLL